MMTSPTLEYFGLPPPPPSTPMHIIDLAPVLSATPPAVSAFELPRPLSSLATRPSWVGAVCSYRVLRSSTSPGAELLANDPPLGLREGARFFDPHDIANLHSFCSSCRPNLLARFIAFL